MSDDAGQSGKTLREHLADVRTVAEEFGTVEDVTIDSVHHDQAGVTARLVSEPQAEIAFSLMKAKRATSLTIRRPTYFSASSVPHGSIWDATDAPVFPGRYISDGRIWHRLPTPGKSP